MTKHAAVAGHLLITIALLFGVGCAADEPGRHRIVPKTQDASSTEASAEELEDAHGPLERGRRLFTGRGICSACHGAEGTGTQIAPDLTDDEWLHIDEPVTTEAIAALIERGISEPLEHPGAMPPRGGGRLDDDDLEAVAAYVYAMSR